MRRNSAVTVLALLVVFAACSSTSTNEAASGTGGASAGSGGAGAGSGGAAAGSGGAAAGSGGGTVGGSGGAVGLDSGGQDATLDGPVASCKSSDGMPVCGSNDAGTNACPVPSSSYAEFLCVEPSTGNAEIKIQGTSKVFWCTMASSQPGGATCKSTAVPSTHLITSAGGSGDCSCGQLYTMGFPFCTWICKASN